MINYDKDPEWDPYNQGDHDFSANLTIDDVWVLYYSVTEAIRLWPGAPARPYQEQVHLSYMKDYLYRMILEHKMTIDVES